MSINIEVTDNINKVIENVNAERKKVEKAAVRALNKTALWLKTQAAQEISEEKKIKLTVMRKRLRIFKAKTSRLDVLMRANLYDIRVSAIGKMRQTRKGAKVGKHKFIGGFMATMPRGNSGVFRREGRTALPIQEVKLGLEPEASKIIKELVNYETEGIFEKYFERELNYIVKV
ncbi:phage tail protein [Wolbachia endosymbiont of Drosophila tristis]|uniref:phage tail protein n=1 Tax=Wolbachia endosymbiont of Drosophila tristis TaxID=267696 RepID=UPI0023A9F17B|nr:phage tail protein [Wolbachia endosymbiont of Drosophila tristis]MDE5064336.1 phage tail protein [Wolbachia endosymbiont of Drosophila tristis]MDU8919852.1 phage tail protein [Wolbachia endosymbiont of Drosophila tristis]